MNRASAADSKRNQSALAKAALEWLTARRSVLALVYFSLFVTPLIVASLARPFGFWDYLTDSDVFHWHRAIEWSTLLPNYWLHLSTAAYILRPTTVFLYDLQAILFGGQFWMWYAVKWAAFFTAIWVAVHIVKQLGCGWAAQLSVASLLLFHHARFTLMLHAPDGWVALGAMAQLALLHRVKGDIAKLGRWRYAAFLALVWFTMGAKETGYVIELVMCAYLVWNNRRALRYLAVPILMIAGWTVRLTGLSHRAKEQFSLTAWISRIFDQIAMLVPGSPDRLLDLCALALTVFACVLAWRWRNEYRGRLILFCMVASLGIITFTTVPPLSGLRYGIPAIFLLSVPFGLAVEEMGRLRPWVTGLMIAFYPLMTAGQIYTQEVAYHQQFFACSRMLQIMDQEAHRGAALTLTGFPNDFGGEFANTIQLYFGSFGSMWYGVTPRQMQSVSTGGWPDSRFVLLSAFQPEVLFKSGTKPLPEGRLERVTAIVPGKHGALSRLQERYTAVQSILRIRTPHLYDYGAPTLNGGPVLYLYFVRAAGTNGDGKWIMEEDTSPQIAGAF